MAMKNTHRGFALLIAMIFMTVLLSIGITLASLGYKQEVLASSGVESQYAFYAADTALECALYADQQQDDFDYNTHSSTLQPNPIECDNLSASTISYSYNSSFLEDEQEISFPASNRCADVTVYKYASPFISPNGTTVNTFIFSQGYDAPCSVVDSATNGSNFESRGISIYY